MQKIYEHPKSKYTWQFSNLDITYFEIPKTGSTSTKIALFRTNYGLEADNDLSVGGGKLALRFPDARVMQFQPENFLGRILIIYRDPILRVKSAYRSIFLGRQKLQGSISEYFENYFPSFVESPATDGLFNHHKPMSWFFPAEIIDDPRVTFIETANLSGLPDLLGLKLAPTIKSQSKMPHMLNANKTIGEIDMTDEEIRKALGKNFEDDFKLYDRLSKRN